MTCSSAASDARYLFENRRVVVESRGDVRFHSGGDETKDVGKTSQQCTVDVMEGIAGRRSECGTRCRMNGRAGRNERGRRRAVQSAIRVGQDSWRLADVSRGPRESGLTRIRGVSTGQQSSEMKVMIADEPTTKMGGRVFVVAYTI